MPGASFDIDSQGLVGGLHARALLPRLPRTEPNPDRKGHGGRHGRERRLHGKRSCAAPRIHRVRACFSGGDVPSAPRFDRSKKNMFDLRTLHLKAFGKGGPQLEARHSGMSFMKLDAQREGKLVCDVSLDNGAA